MAAKVGRRRGSIDGVAAPLLLLLAAKLNRDVPLWPQSLTRVLTLKQPSLMGPALLLTAVWTSSWVGLRQAWGCRARG